MGDDVRQFWRPGEHLAAGMLAIKQIEHECFGRPERVCHHFVPITPLNPIEVNITDHFSSCLAHFSRIDLEFLPDRQEAWETVSPNERWLSARIPALIDAACNCRLIYLGWTYEPKGHQPIGACQIPVINNQAT